MKGVLEIIIVRDTARDIIILEKYIILENNTREIWTVKFIKLKRKNLKIMRKKCGKYKGDS